MRVASEVNQDDERDCLSDGHAEFMRSYCAWEEIRAEKTLDLFLAGKLRQAIDSKPS
jgi:hypothetical protein